MADAREQFPEIAAVADYIRATHGPTSIQRAWVENSHGVVLAGRRPDSERGMAYLEPEGVLAAAARFNERAAAPRRRR